MADSCIHVEEVQILPIIGPNVRVVSTSGDAILHFCIERDLLRSFATESIQMLDDADSYRQLAHAG